MAEAEEGREAKETKEGRGKPIQQDAELLADRQAYRFPWILPD
jgi:hypothetical protein